MTARRILPVLLALLCASAFPSGATANITGDPASMTTYTSIGAAMKRKANRTTVYKQYDEGILTNITTTNFNVRKKFVYERNVDLTGSHASVSTISTPKSDWSRFSKGTKCWTKHTSSYKDKISEEFNTFNDADNILVNMVASTVDADTLGFSSDETVFDARFLVSSQLNYNPATLRVTSTNIMSTITPLDGSAAAAHSTYNTTYTYKAPSRAPKMKKLCAY